MLEVVVMVMMMMNRYVLWTLPARRLLRWMLVDQLGDVGLPADVGTTGDINPVAEFGRDLKTI